MNQNGNEGSNSTKKMLPGRKRDYEHHNARRDGTNNSKSVELSPQPPRVMSVQERKQILLRRSNSRTGIGWKRSIFNDSTGSARNLSTRFSDSIAQSSQSVTATSTVDASEDNRSKRFRRSRNSPFLNDSQCSESTNIISSSTILDESRLPSGATSSLPASALDNGKHLSSPKQNSKQGENTKFTMYSSPRPNESDKKNPTPSSLFGEIMKRLPLSPTRTNTSTHKATSQDTPSPISNRLELDLLDDKKVENGEPQILFDPKEPSPISRKRFRSLVPSITRRPTNIFKQYSKSSEPVGSTLEAKSINQTHSQTKRGSIFNSPKHDRKPSPHSSPIINKSSLSQFSTPERNQSNSVSWDVNTPTTAYKGPLFKRSLMTPEQKTSSTVTSKRGVLSAKSPDRKTNTRASWSPNTPDSSRLQRGSPKGDRHHNSPGGMTLLRALNGCMSPKILYKNGTGEGDGSKSSVGSTSNGQHDEWKECFINLPSFVQHNDEDIQDAEFLPTKVNPTHLDLVRGQVGFLDWSLKRGIKIDCYPDDCIPGTPLNNDIDTNAPSSDFSFRTKGSRNHHRIDSMAMDIFMFLEHFNRDDSICSSVPNLILLTPRKHCQDVHRKYQTLMDTNFTSPVRPRGSASSVPILLLVCSPQSHILFRTRLSSSNSE